MMFLFVKFLFVGWTGAGTYAFMYVVYMITPTRQQCLVHCLKLHGNRQSELIMCTVYIDTKKK